MYNISFFFFQLIDRSERNDENGGEKKERRGMTWIVRDVVKLVH